MNQNTPVKVQLTGAITTRPEKSLPNRSGLRAGGIGGPRGGTEIHPDLFCAWATR